MLKPDEADNFTRNLPTKRRCGECELCCTAMPVEGMKKPMGVRCSALRGEPGQSCSIYSDRPIDCRAFLCFWRGSDTLLPERMWPAKCGFVIAQGNHFGDHPMVITIHPDPDHPDSWKAPQNRVVFSGLAKRFNAIVVVGQHDKARYIFAPNGNQYSREHRPELFAGPTVGLPAGDFLPHHLSRDEMLVAMFNIVRTA